MKENIKATIFDLDGTLVDSMWVWSQIDIDYLASKNLTVPPALKDEISHLGFIDVALYFKKRFNIDDDLNTILETWNNMALEHYSHNVKLKPGVLDFLKYLKSNNIKIGLASSSNLLLIESVLKSNGIYEYFDAITTTDEAKKDKSNPDVYLLAADKLKTAPEDCVVFEDIAEGIKGAKLAKMSVIAVYDESSKDKKETLSELADDYIYDFNELIK
ncbi:MAG: HAD family phosphatase [Clostridium sp.]|uniref:HAD family hydrolase n=1 Tax=Clostridium sp. DSM 8431 TaxID=1761781 RepID=UPI0008F2A904|nr:HAD family phosphatase [Clostridium sp. DSM 8431]MCR4945254.1 HAD family phosphatase [Clostridium sp.]SFU81001.1 haloacid dehalogenase superfamily, subfamily IA, variant 3 with third motif having DD or ED [Clostridium sp. DSM 8431]